MNEVVRNLLERALEIVRGSTESPVCGLVLGGGGARGAYQAGVLRYVGEHFSAAAPEIMTGVSAGAINAVGIANHVGPLDAAAGMLVEAWQDLMSDRVYEERSGWGLLWDVLRRGDPGDPVTAAEMAALAQDHGLVDTQPLREFLMEKFGSEDGMLPGIARNVDNGRVRACAVMTTSYTTGQTVTWIEGQEIDDWERPDRVGVPSRLTVDHVMASTSLPLFFPAVFLSGAWYGDGGVRLSAPLAPAVHLGADRILAISTRYSPSRAEADEPAIEGYPPAAQILGVLASSVFLDALEQDAHHLRRVNRLLEELPRRKWGNLRPVRLLLIRPSVDLSRLASEYQIELPGTLRLLARGLGSRETRSPDSLSLLLFEREYIDRLIEIGYEDAGRRHAEIEAFLCEGRE